MYMDIHIVHNMHKRVYGNVYWMHMHRHVCGQVNSDVYGHACLHMSRHAHRQLSKHERRHVRRHAAAGSVLSWCGKCLTAPMPCDASLWLIFRRLQIPVNGFRPLLVIVVDTQSTCLGTCLYTRVDASFAHVSMRTCLLVDNFDEHADGAESLC